MSIEPAATFRLDDLAVFDEAHLRELISDVSGAVPLSIAGGAFAADESLAELPHAELASRIEQSLAPTDRATFARARRQTSASDERETSRQAMLKTLFWELVYWKMPDDYDLLTAGEQVHLGALDIARVDGAIVLDAAAGAGRITLPLARRARLVYALDAAPPLLRVLERKIASADMRNVELLRGLFRRIPLPDDSVDATISCSAFGPLEARGGGRGLDELQRVTRAGGRIVILRPEDPAWFVARGFQYVSLPGHLTITFPTLADALDVTARFYGRDAVRHLEKTRRPELPYHTLGVNAPRNICWLTVRK
jgi:ubiquinone/menaquinone biosynthesis C-methylase UbiE